MNIIYAAILVFVTASCASIQKEYNGYVSVCDLVNNASKFDGEFVMLRDSLWANHHGPIIYSDDSCGIIGVEYHHNIPSPDEEGLSTRFTFAAMRNGGGGVEVAMGGKFVVWGEKRNLYKIVDAKFVEVFDGK